MKSRMVLPMVLVTGMMLSLGQGAHGATGSTTICKWKNNTKAVVSFSCDDSPLIGNLSDYAAVLNPRGIKMTFYIMTYNVGQWGSWDDYPPIAAMGHELGPHPDGCNITSEADARARLEEGISALEQHVPGNGKVLTTAWHYCGAECIYNSLLPEYLIAQRGTTGDMCCFTSSANPSTTDLCSNGSMFNLMVGGPSNGAVDEIISAGGWRNFYRHSLGDWPGGADGLGALLDYLVSKQDEVWTAPIRDVSQYIYERNASAVQTVSADQTRIVLSLTHSLATTVCDFDFPLTLKTEVPAGWDDVTVGQGTTADTVQATDESGTKHVYFDAQPNTGNITLTETGSTAIRPEVFTREADRNAGQRAWPNPVGFKTLVRYLRQGDMGVCDLAGKDINSAMLKHAGVYILKDRVNRTWRAIMVLDSAK